MRPDHQPATVLELAAHGTHLRLALSVGDRAPMVLTLGVDDHTGRLLTHVHALHGHSEGCGGRADVHVDLLLRCCRLLGSGSPRLIVRAGDAPAFWLEVVKPCGDRAHLDLGTLDAVVLLASRQVPVAVETASAPEAGVAGDTDVTHDWDDALRTLLDEGA